MKKRVWGVICCFFVLVTGLQAATTVNTVVTSKDRSITFTWTFEDCEKGQFANGDWWVAPAAGQSGVTLTSLTGNGSGPVYADENPRIEAMGLLSKNYGNQDTTENIIPRLPITYDYTTSLVAVMQRDEATYGNCGTGSITGCCADAYQVVTVLDAVPVNNGADMLRPNITDPVKELLTWDDFDLTRMPALDYLTGTDTDGLENIRRTWSHHIEIMAMRDTAGTVFSEGGRAFRAEMIIDDYAGIITTRWHTHMMIMMSDDQSVEEKKAALAAMLTYGKDIFYQVYTPEGVRRRWFGSGAGQHIGHFPPAVFFAALCEDPLYGDALRSASTTQVNIGSKSVQEMDQVNPGPNGPVWGDRDDFSSTYAHGTYWGEVLGSQKFDGATGNYPSSTGGQRTSRDPYLYIDGPGIGPLAAYGSLTTGLIIAFAAEMYIMPEICDITDYDPICEYSNRFINHGKLTAPDPCAPPDPRENPALCDPYRCKGCSYYGLKWDPDSTDAPTWGPDPDSVKDGTYFDCIRNHEDPLSGEQQTGRFSQMDGDPVSLTGSYTVTQAMARWRYFTLGRSLTSCKKDTTAIADPMPGPVRETKPVFSLYPNPSTGLVYADGPSATFSVYDHSGKLVKTFKKFTVLDEGIYLVTGEDGRGAQRLVVVK